MGMVKINVELLKNELKAMGITQEAVGIRLGKSKTWLANLLSTGATNDGTVRQIEEVLFKPAGHYELKETEKAEPTGGADTVKYLQEVVKWLSVIRAQNEEIIATMNSWRKTNTEQTANLIDRSKDNITQTMKVRSAFERAWEDKK